MSVNPTPAAPRPTPLNRRLLWRQRLSENEAPAALGAVATFGAHVRLGMEAFAWLFRPPFRSRLFFEQMEFIGVGSLPIIILVGFFTGLVSSLQAFMALGM